MRYYLLSDCHDTYTGLRLAGIDGTIVHTKEEVAEAIQKALSDSSIGILLITESLAKLVPELVLQIKTHRKKPLLVKIPNRHGSNRPPDSITRYVREAIGIRL